jgi:hypothetical protein
MFLYINILDYLVLLFGLNYQLKLKSDNTDYRQLTENVRHGQFEFVYTDVLGKIKTMQLAHDSSWEGKIAVFPAAMHHQVYPHHVE